MSVQRRPNGTLLPGSVINPHGGQMHSHELRSVRKMTYEQVADIGQMILENDTPKLEALADDVNAPVLKRYIAKMLQKGMNRGDPTPLNAILDRIIGKVADKVDITISNPFTSLTDQEKLDRARQVVLLLESKLEHRDQ